MQCGVLLPHRTQSQSDTGTFTTRMLFCIGNVLCKMSPSRLYKPVPVVLKKTLAQKNIASLAEILPSKSPKLFIYYYK